jgi:hypothetical protein
MSTSDTTLSHTQGTISSLPNDLLTCMFEALYDCGSSQLILPLMRVCKYWNVSVCTSVSIIIIELILILQLIAHPLLVRRLEFTTLSQLERTLTALELHESQGKHLWKWIRAIIIDFPVGVENNQFLLRILLHVIHLQYLSIENAFNPEILDTLYVRLCHSLTRLHIEIGTESASSILTSLQIVGYVNRFKNIKTLEINYCGYWPDNQMLGFATPHLERIRPQVQDPGSIFKQMSFR